MVMMLLIMELLVGPNLAADHCLSLLHISWAHPAHLVMRGPPNYCSILILKATAIHLLLLIATSSPVLGSFYSHTSHLCLSVHQDFPLKLDILIHSINWRSRCQVPFGVRVQAIPSQVQIYKSSTSPIYFCALDVKG